MVGTDNTTELGGRPGYILFTKLSQTFDDFRICIEKLDFFSTTALATFGQFWGKFGVFLYQHMVTLIWLSRCKIFGCKYFKV